MPNIFDVKKVFTDIPELLRYLPVTLEITVISMIVGLIFAFLIAIIKVKKIPVLSQIAGVFVSFTRGTPMLVQLYLTYYGIPIALKYFNYYKGTNYNINNIPSIIFVLIAFSLNEAAYNSENIRGAILSLDKGEIEAAHSIGMNPWQVFYRITLPETFTIALPALGNSLISLIKGTSLAFVCAVVEMTARGKIIAGNDYRYFEVYISLALIYWAITIIIEQVMKRIEKKLAIPGTVSESNNTESTSRHRYSFLGARMGGQGK
ncbi:MAG TPA: amino acid ABC transporter permease [Candidatus Merdenecus merdavium]|nr:amino acid ABC transporter permease [Candidatus Merdenecus merdavium]